MSAILEDLYFGELDPAAMIGGSEAAGRADLLEQLLWDRFTGDDRHFLSELLNAHSDELGGACVENFLVGFRLGARLMLEVLEQPPGR